MPDIGSALAILEGAKTAIETVELTASSTAVVRAERRAGQNRFSVNTSALEESFTATLHRLTTVDEPWWREILARCSHAYVAPDFFRIQSVQEWLALAQTQDNLKALAIQRISGIDEDGKIRTALSESFMHSTGENTARADDAISLCLAILVAGAYARLSPELRVFSSIEETRHQKTQANQAEILQAVCDLGGQTVVTKIARGELDRILKRRGIPGCNALLDLEKLWERVENGDLKGAKAAVESDLRYWLATLNATATPPQSAIVEQHLERLRAIDPSRDVRLVEAWLIADREDFDRAVQHVRDIDDDYARSTVFALLLRKDRQIAFEWLMERRSQGVELLTARGWLNAAVLLAENGLWDESIHDLDNVSGAQRDECPETFYAEGVIHAAMLLPSDWRMHALQDNVFHPQASRVIRADEQGAYHSRKALDCFDEAARRLQSVNAESRYNAARRWQLWIRLRSTDTLTRDTARAELSKIMSDGRQAVDHVELAWAYNRDSDLETLRRYLANQDRFGGMREPELHAKLVLLRWQGPPADLAEFIDRERARLGDIAPPEMLIGLQVEALAHSGEPERAALVLENHATELGDATLRQLRDLVRLHRGESVRLSREEHYQTDPSLENLLNLVQTIEADGDFTALKPYAEKLVEEAPNTANLTRLAHCLEISDPDDELLKFLEEQKVFVENDVKLTAIKAWALFRLGRLAEARSLNDSLLTSRASENDLYLAINIALQSGEWERLPALVEQGWNLRTTLSSGALLFLARIAGETHTDRALAFAELCAERASDNPHILLAAYCLAIQLGHEGATPHSWLTRAASLSGPDGPVQSFSLRQLVNDLMPAAAERQRAVEKALNENRIPLATYAGMRNLPLAQILIGQPERNRKTRDARHRIILPIYSGNRNSLAIDANVRISLDATSLFVLGAIDALEQVIDGFGGIAIPPSTMELLIRERQRLRFHQPSLISRAKKIRVLVDDNSLEVFEVVNLPQTDLVEKFGFDLASLVDAASRDNGVVVHPFPIHAPDSLGERDVVLGEPPPPIVDTRRLVEGLLEHGYLDQSTAGDALSILATLDLGSDHNVDMHLDRPIYLDELAISYMQTAGLLEKLSGLGLRLRVSANFRNEQFAIISAHESSQAFVDRLDSIRKLLCDHIKTGRVVHIPIQKDRIAEDGERKDIEGDIATLKEVIGNSCGCDALCIDDRFVNSHAVATDREGKTLPMLTTVDLLRSLRKVGRLLDNDWYRMLHSLRACGFALMPIESDELLHRLRASRLDSDGAIRETYELKIIRQYLAMLRGRDVVQPSEVEYLYRTSIAVIAALRELWTDVKVPFGLVEASSSWLHRYVFPSPLEWTACGNYQERQDAFVRAMISLIQIIPILTDRQTEYAEWLNREVLTPFAPAAPELLDQIATAAASYISSTVDEFAHDAS